MSSPWDEASAAGVDLSFCTEAQFMQILAWCPSDETDVPMQKCTFPINISTDTSLVTETLQQNLVIDCDETVSDLRLLDDDAVDYLDQHSDAPTSLRQAHAFYSVLLDGLAEGMSSPEFESAWVRIFAAGDMLFLRASLRVLALVRPVNLDANLILDTQDTTASLTLPATLASAPRFTALSKASMLCPSALALTQKALQVVMLYQALLPRPAANACIASVFAPPQARAHQLSARAQLGTRVTAASEAVPALSFLQVVAAHAYGLGLLLSPSLARAHGQRVARLAADPSIAAQLSNATETSAVDPVLDADACADAWRLTELSALDEDDLEVAQALEQQCATVLAALVHTAYTALATAGVTAGVPAGVTAGARALATVVPLPSAALAACSWMPLVAHALDTRCADVLALLDAVHAPAHAPAVVSASAPASLVFQLSLASAALTSAIDSAPASSPASPAAVTVPAAALDDSQVATPTAVATSPFHEPTASPSPSPTSSSAPPIPSRPGPKTSPRASGASTPIRRPAPAAPGHLVHNLPVGSASLSALYQPSSPPDALCRALVEHVNATAAAEGQWRVSLAAMQCVRAAMRMHAQTVYTSVSSVLGGAACSLVAEDALLFSGNDLRVLVDILLRKIDDSSDADPLQPVYALTLAALVARWEGYGGHRQEEVTQRLTAAVAANGYKLDTAQIDQETYGDIQEVGDIFKFITENSVLMTAEFDAALESLHPETESDDDSHQGIAVSF